MKAFLLAVFVMLVLFFSACSTGTSNIQAKNNTAEEFVLVPPAMESPFYAAVIEGAQPQAVKMGYKLTVLSPQNADDYTEQAKIIEDIADRKVAGIAVCAHNEDVIIQPVLDANRVGIPVVVFNSLTSLTKGEVYAYVGYDQAAGGARIADWINQKTNGHALVGILEGLPGFHTTERERGFLERIKQYSGIKIAATQEADWDRVKGMNAAAKMLQANPEITVFYGLNDEMALGAQQAVEAAGKKGILCIGIDGNPNTLQDVKNGKIAGTLFVNPQMIGKESVMMLDEALRVGNGIGKKIVVDTIVLDQTNVGQYLK